MADSDDEVPQLVADEAIMDQTDNSTTAAQTASLENPSTKSDADTSIKVALPSPPPAAVPLTILTGWLGAGKTTLLTRQTTQQAGILEYFSSRGESIAIIQNEASSFGVEIGLQLQDDSGAFNSLLELSNGCVCCSVKSDFLMGVEELLKRKRFAYIILECSGLADPGPLAQLFWVDPELESTVYLDGIISVVDGKNFLRHLSSTHELESSQVIHQIAYADRIILNKMDLIRSEEERQECLDEIRNINQAEVYCTTKSELDLTKILHIKAFDVNDTTRAVMPPLESVHEPQLSSTSSPSVPVAHPHDHTITTFMCDNLHLPSHERREVDLAKLKLWLVDLLWQDSIESEETSSTTPTTTTAASASAPNSTSITTNSASSASSTTVPVPASSTRPNEIFRLKAIMCVHGESDHPTFLQGVQQLYDLQPGQEWPNQPITKEAGIANQLVAVDTNANKNVAPERFTRFVFIGRRLDHATLRAGFESILC